MFTIEKFSHYFRVSAFPYTIKRVLDQFSLQFVQYGLKRERGRFFRVPMRIYGAANKARTEYRFHINAFDTFLLALAKGGVKPEEYAVIESPFPEAEPTKHVIQDGWAPMPHQHEPLAYLHDTENTQRKFVSMQTGKGKSYCAMEAAAHRQSRVVMTIGAKYIDKWIIDLKKTYKVKKKDYMAVRGSLALIKALTLGMKGRLKAKFIIISNTTLRNWIDLYEEDPELMKSKGYPCTPDQYMSALRAQCRITDEVHEDFHFNFKLDLYTHCEWSISLSATLIHKDEFMRRMYELAFPKALRYEKDEYDRYIDAYALIYRIDHPNKIRCVGGDGRYSHTMFEQSMMRNPGIMRNYMAMFKQDLDVNFFTNQYLSKDKALILVSTIEFAHILSGYLKQMYPNLVVRHYVSGDDYEHLMESDICISTPQSAGTGVDIPNLMYVCLTIAVSSIQRNVQGFGRLRKPKDGRTPRFTYAVCDDISKHVMYHVEKKEILSTRALNYRATYHSRPI